MTDIMRPIHAAILVLLAVGAHACLFPDMSHNTRGCTANGAGRVDCRMRDPQYCVARGGDGCHVGDFCEHTSCWVGTASSCGAISGCGWDGQKCALASDACESADRQACLATAGCIWRRQSCDGTAPPCDALAEVDCRAASYCAWH